MKIVKTATVPEEYWRSPQGTFEAYGRQISIALGRDPESNDAMLRHPFDVEMSRLPPQAKPFPFHSHSAQWEFYHILAGTGLVRHDGGTDRIETGDAFVFKPGEPHQLINDGDEDLIWFVVADNPQGESCHYPDSGKWAVRSPERRLLRSEPLDYYDGEE